MREPIVASLLVIAFLQAILGMYAWQRRHKPAAKPLAYIAGICCAWAATYGLDLASENLQQKIILMLVRFCFTTFAPPAVLAFSLEHLGLSKRLSSKQWGALLFLPILIIPVLWTGQYHELFRYDFWIQQVGDLPILRWKSGLFLWISFFYNSTLLLSSLVLLLSSLPGSLPLKRRQTSLILGALMLPFVVDTLYNYGISPIPGFNFTPHAFLVTWLTMAYAIFQYRFLDIVPLARNTLVDIISMGVIVLDTEQKIVDINPLAQKVLRVSADVVGQPITNALAHINPDTMAQIDIQKPRQEIQTLRPSGERVYFEAESIVLKGVDGKFNGRLLLFYDVTERKTKELQLLQFSQAVNQSPTSVVITNLTGNIEYVNPQFTELTGYTPAEVQGKSSRLLKSGQTPPEVYQQMWQTISSGGVWRGEFLNKKKNGELYWEAAVIAPVKNDKNEIVNYIAVKEDITAQKGMLAALRESEAQLRNLNQELSSRLEKIMGLEAELREQALRDPLTGLHNRRYLNEMLDREIERVRRSREPLSVIMLDIDHFKFINDTYGHLMGDQCLQMLAKLLQKGTRKADIACRYGGEEFILVMPGAPLEMATERAESLRLQQEKMQMPTEMAGRIVTLSAGVASFPQNGKTYTEVVNHADQALYLAKKQGRNRVEVWRQA